ncbi:MAG: putative toxin-antitoxin system toxin component, PIN family [Caldimonas sp.]
MVLDTNIVLDLFFFHDARCGPLAEAVMQRHLQWVASTEMREELSHVLSRGIRGSWIATSAAVLEAFDRWTTRVESPGSASRHDMRCTDPDDQKFIDVALHVKAAALISRDRAVLKLARRATAHSLRIVTLSQWTEQAARMLR